MCLFPMSPRTLRREAQKLGMTTRLGEGLYLFKPQWPDDISEKVSRAAEKQVFRSAHAPHGRRG